MTTLATDVFTTPALYYQLLLVTFGAVGYIVTDKEFQSQGWVAYYWVAIWWAVLLFQLTYGKFLVSGLPLKMMGAAEAHSFGRVSRKAAGRPVTKIITDAK